MKLVWYLATGRYMPSLLARVLKNIRQKKNVCTSENFHILFERYGEDDDKDGDSIEITVGTSNLIPALESAIVGMKSGGRRRILVRPER